ncbi:hypothetical protein N7493_010700 [Penicillium malachiteum]|uniref:RNA recognition motif-containing protein n=1 Tax=Penicillium malachiteum TaxID=1324776 RepID=A0AAD6HDA8_9EURO|nr:hypothetical protein N7493_010700 [Penicillium malachiteum]
MPPQPGEEILVNVLADIHYYFTAPTPKSLHDRFEKGSYLYIYHNASQNTVRLEVANNAGTQDQDAFQASFLNVHIQHSTQFPTLCTVTVDGFTGRPEDGASQYDWRLPSLDRPNDLIRIHTLDIYFWSLEDSNQFLDAAGHVLDSDQVETDRDISIEQSDEPLSSVVQQLENVAVTDPAYQNGQTPDSQFEPPPMSAPVAQAAPATLSFPPPPPSGPSIEQPQAVTERQVSVSPEQPKEPEAIAPLPYNPAAPAAPEPIQHREKTPPPPEDGTQGTGLAEAAKGMSLGYTPPHQPTNVGIGSFAPPPTSTPGMPYNTAIAGPPGYASPPPSAGLAHANSFGMPGTPLGPLHSPGLPTYQQSFMTGHPVHQAGSMSFAPPSHDPNAYMYAQQGYGVPQQQTQPGYSNYSYEQQQQQQHQRSGSEYDIHAQVYRPTSDEVNSHAQKMAKKAMKAPGQRPHSIEDKAHRMEGGVNRFLKRLEKKLG